MPNYQPQKESDLHFKRGDLIEVDAYRGYVNCICFATRSHLHPEPTTSYFTLTLEGTERTARAVNVCIPDFQWKNVTVIKSVDNYPDYKSQEHRYSDPQ